MMDKFTLNGFTVKTNLKQNKVYEISKPTISYPYSFTNNIKKIKQTFLTGVNNVPPFTPSVTHPQYSNAYLIEQSENEADPIGFAEYTRTYIQFSGTVSFPTTISYTYPALFDGLNYAGRGIEVVKEKDEDNSYTGNYTYVGGSDAIEMPKVTRGKPVTITVPVTEVWEMVNASTHTSEFRPSNTWEVGANITVGGTTYTIQSNDGNGGIVIQDSEGTSSNLTDFNGVSYSNAESDFSELTITNKFQIRDSYHNTSGINYVDFVDDSTYPNFLEYSAMTQTEHTFPLQNSRIEHLGGFIYIKKTPYGKLR